MTEQILIDEDLQPQESDINELFERLCKQQHFAPKHNLYIFKKELHQPQLHQHYMNTLRLSQFADLTVAMMNYFYYTKFEPSSYKREYEETLRKVYFQLFVLVAHPKDEMIAFALAVCAFCVKRLLFEVKPQVRDQIDERYTSFFNQRLLYEIYHTLIFKVNGTLVSDSYIKIQFDGIFNSKFMEYKISDFERNIQRKKHGITKKDHHHHTHFLGQSQLKLPQIHLHNEGEDFQRILSERLRPKRRQDNHIHSKIFETLRDPEQTVKHKDEKKIFQFKNMHMNLNQVSPSISQVLEFNNNQIPETNPQMVSHKLQYYNNKDGMIIEMLQRMSIEKERQKVLYKQSAVKKKKKLLDQYDNTPIPQPEYFQKHPKLDGMFKEMLEMNHILKYNTQRFSELASSKEVRKFLKEQQSDKELLKNNKNNRAMSNLEQSEMRDMSLSMVSHSIEPPRLETPMTLLPTLKFIPLEREQDAFRSLPTTRAPSVHNKSKFYSAKQVESVDASQNKVLPISDRTGEQHKKQRKDWKFDFVYVDNRDRYHNQYADIIDKSSTDSKIHNIVQKLQNKQNVFSKALRKKK